MNNRAKNILLVTNGAEEGYPALEYGAWLAKKLEVSVKLLGIAEQEQGSKTLLTAIKKAEASLVKLEVAHETITRQGEVRDIVCKLPDLEQYLIVIGPLGNPRWLRWLRGRNYRHLLEKISTPLIYVPQAQNDMRHILVCMGGLGYALGVEEWAIFLAQKTNANLTILHILEKVFYDYPTASEIQSHGEEILESDTPHAHNLRLALENAKEAGIQTSLKVRHGDVIHEILAEIGSGNYDLVAMGTHSSAQSMRRLFMPNVTAEVAESIAIPVLTAPPDPILQS
jgi:nucleotide-binding universal stress UspA family protein